MLGWDLRSSYLCIWRALYSLEMFFLSECYLRNFCAVRGFLIFFFLRFKRVFDRLTKNLSVKKFIIIIINLWNHRIIHHLKIWMFSWKGFFPITLCIGTFFSPLLVKFLPSQLHFFTSLFFSSFFPLFSSSSFFLTN